MKEQIFRLGKSSIIYGAGTMLTRFISLVLLPLFTSYLSPSDYGVLALLALLAMVAQPVFGIGMSAAMGPSYFESNEPLRKSETIWTTFLILVISVSILIVIAWIVPKTLSILIAQTPKYAYFVSLTLTGSAFGILSTPFTQRIQFEEKAKTFVVITLLSSLISISLSILTVVTMRWGVEGMVTSQVVGQAITFLMFFIMGVRGTRFIYSKKIMNELLRLGIPLIPGFAFTFILMQGNRYILQLFSGVEQVGIFSIGFNIGLVLNLAVGAVGTAWYPFFMSYMERQQEATILFGRIFTYYIFLFGVLCMLFFVGSKLVITVLTQPAFHDAYMVVGFSASAIFFTGIFNMLLPGIYFKKEIRYVSVVQGLAAVISIGLNIILIKWAGFFGAGIALSLGHLLMAVFLYLWNIYRKNDYIRIKYEGLRLAKFLFLFVFIIVSSFLDRGANLWIELGYITILICIISISLYLLLNKNELVFIKEKLFLFKSIKA